MGRSTVERHLCGLEEKRLLRRLRHGSKNNTYRLNIPLIHQRASEANAAIAEEEAKKSQDEFGQVVLTTAGICHAIKAAFPTYPLFTDPDHDALELEADVEVCVQIAGNHRRCMELLFAITKHEPTMREQLLKAQEFGLFLREAFPELLARYGADISPINEEEGASHE